MRHRVWRWFALLAAGLVLAFLALPPSVHWQVQWVIDILVLVTLVLAPRLHGTPHRLPWNLLAAAMVAILVAAVGNGLTERFGWPESVRLVTGLGFVTGNVLIGLATWVVLRARAAGRPVLTADAAIVALGVGVVLWQLVTPPDLVAVLDLPPGPGSVAVVSTYPVFQAVCSTCCFLLLASSARRVMSGLLLGLGGLCLVGGYTGWLMGMVNGTFAVNGPVAALWPIAYLLLALAALHPSMQAVTMPDDDPAGTLSTRRIGVLAAALVLVQASVLATVDLRDRGTHLLLLMLLLTAVALARMITLTREREAAQAEQRRAIDRQASLARLGHKALAVPDDQALIEQALAMLTRDLDAPWAAFLEPDDQGMRVRAALGTVPAVAEHWRIPERSRVVGLAGDEQVALVAVRGRLEMFGMLACGAPDRGQVGEGELNVLSSVAHVLAGAFERRRAEEQIRLQALHDPLTGLPNRVLLGDRLSAAIARAKRSERVVAVLFIDLDGFKQVNDTYGHRAGDELLRAVAGRIKRLLRAEDTLARFAGDEFVVVVEADDQASVLALARRINEALAAPFGLAVGEVSISGSIGITLAGPEADVDRLLGEADMAMYRAKEAGKDRSEVFAGSV